MEYFFQSICAFAIFMIGLKFYEFLFLIKVLFAAIHCLKFEIISTLFLDECCSREDGLYSSRVGSLSFRRWYYCFIYLVFTINLFLMNFADDLEAMTLCLLITRKCVFG